MNIDENLLIEMLAARLLNDSLFQANVAVIAAKQLLESSRTPTSMDVVQQIKDRIAEMTRERAEEIGRMLARSLDHRAAQKVEQVLATWSEKSIRNILAETVRRVAYDVLAKRLKPHMDAAVRALLKAAEGEHAEAEPASEEEAGDKDREEFDR